MTATTAPAASSALPMTQGNTAVSNPSVPRAEQSPDPSIHTSDEDHMADSEASKPPSIRPQPDLNMAAHASALHQSLLHVPGAIAPPAVTPKVFRVIPSEGPKSGGIEITILGEGFYPGIDVLFANAAGTRLAIWGSQTITCLIPPSFQAGLVRVSVGGHHQPDPQVYFRYIDTDERDLMRLALAVQYHRTTGKFANPSDIARSIIGSQQAQAHQQASQGAQHQQQFASSTVNFELSILAVLDIIDQADSDIVPRYNACQPNGQTMLHLSASLGYHRLAAGLLARGANPSLRDRNGMSAMHFACLHGHTKVVRKLLSAGGDPSLRSLLGLTPIDMATTHDVYEIMSNVERHRRSRSVGATPASQMSRASSMMSTPSMRAAFLGGNTAVGDGSLPFDEALVEAYRSRPVTPAQIWARSRRNSAKDHERFFSGQHTNDPGTNTHLVAAATAMAAWRDNLAGQIQYFQQSVQRTLPNLQIPTLPPLPNFDAYQEHPMVRRISSLVPRMNSPPAPPAYDEIYPDSVQEDSDVKKASAARAVGDAFLDEKCAVNFDRIKAEPSGDVKRLRNDRKLFMIWVGHDSLQVMALQLTGHQIPLLILVVVAMTKDWAPQVFRGIQQVLAGGNA